MPGAPVQMGPNAVGNPAALISALKSQQPPSNPQTPAERTNPDQQALEHVKAAQVSLERAKVYTNDPHMQMVFDVVGGTLTKALLKFDGAAVLQSLAEAVQSVSPMGGPASGMGGQPPTSLPMGGMPPQGGMPPMGGVQAAPPQLPVPGAVA